MSAGLRTNFYKFDLRYLIHDFTTYSLLSVSVCRVMNNELISPTVRRYIYLLQLGCYPVTVVTLHVNKT